MAKTLDEIRALSIKPAAPAPAPDETPMYHRPFGVVVVSSQRGEPKFVFGYDTEEEAEAERVRRQSVEDVRWEEQKAQREMTHLQLVADTEKENKRRTKLGIAPLPLPDPRPDPPTFTYYVATKPPGGWQ